MTRLSSDYADARALCLRPAGAAGRPRGLARLALILSLVASSAGLSACYVSGDLLLDPADAAHPLADGVYVRQGDPGDRFRLTLEPDGWYAVERLGADGVLGETHRVLASRSDEGFVLAEADDDGFSYAVARVEGPRLFLAAPDCADSLDRDDAVDHSAAQDDDFRQVCRFKTREALATALSAFAGHADFGAPYLFFRNKD